VEAWGTFATISGGAAAALTGLLFVAVSIRIASVAQSQELRNRAAQTLTLFGTVLIVSVLLAIPGQAPGPAPDHARYVRRSRSCQGDRRPGNSSDPTANPLADPQLVPACQNSRLWTSTARTAVIVRGGPNGGS
jgi:hypothetical protein